MAGLRQFRALIAAAQAAGADDVLVTTGGKHVRLTGRYCGRSFVVVVSVSASDRRAGLNQLRDLRRAMDRCKEGITVAFPVTRI
jgi:hypothetical protein